MHVVCAKKPWYGSDMKKRRGRGGYGFTIIEITLVLAVAGLIFLIVFLAVPAAQRAVRDEQRRKDTGLLLSAVLSWKLNTNKKMLDTNADLQSLKTKNYFKAVDPSSGQPYTLPFYSHSVIHTAVTIPAVGEIVYVSGHHCGSDPGGNTLITAEPVMATHNLPQFAVLTKLELGGVYCLDSR